MFEDVLGKLAPLSYSARFSSGVDYRSTLFDARIDRTAARRFQEELRLPRHIGVLAVFGGDVKLCDLLIDVTEYQRHPLNPSVVGLVCPGVPKGSGPALNLTKVASWFKAPIILAPASP